MIPQARPPLLDLLQRFLRRASGAENWPPGREEVLLEAFRFVRRNMLGGDYLEFGVYRGDTIHLAYCFSEYMSNRGEQKAFGEWREQHPEWLVGEFMTSHDNKAFVTNRAE
jgi:hypothetical protein